MDENTYVYCTKCRRCRLDKMGHTNCGFEDACWCYDTEDGRRFAERPYYRVADEIKSRRDYLVNNFRWIKNEEHPDSKVFFTFDGYNIYHIIKDYPDALSPLEKEVFDELNPASIFVLENGSSEDSDNDISFADENFRRKEKRYKSRKVQMARERRRFNRLRASKKYRPSIWADESTGRVERAKHSHYQKFYKKYSNRKTRKMSINIALPKGNDYRKEFDYWWGWALD